MRGRAPWHRTRRASRPASNRQSRTRCPSADRTGRASAAEGVDTRGRRERGNGRSRRSVLHPRQDTRVRRRTKEHGVDARGAKSVGIAEHPASGEIAAKIGESQPVRLEEILNGETPSDQSQHRASGHRPRITWRSPRPAPGLGSSPAQPARDQSGLKGRVDEVDGASPAPRDADHVHGTKGDRCGNRRHSKVGRDTVAVTAAATEPETEGDRQTADRPGQPEIVLRTADRLEAPPVEERPVPDPR